MINQTDILISNNKFWQHWYSIIAARLPIDSAESSASLRGGGTLHQNGLYGLHSGSPGDF